MLQFLYQFEVSNIGIEFLLPNGLFSPKKLKLYKKPSQCISVHIILYFSFHDTVQRVRVKSQDRVTECRKAPFSVCAGAPHCSLIVAPVTVDSYQKGVYIEIACKLDMGF